ncbi:uncharacterized protein UV8b_02146 [Ustilaginoidea virens]|uniref:holo-[acyl-carrier-protein] synthase n=1 Tax=Ustilaginoidea virens TaxID=1159556 RepID=A0A8E5HLX3_USTVR|nr:uncharacterized protein UV8b_02146 [Ustilaginoidea virens]QUC17905.1 hypothetical protein UV8b_02146 [Ustilaginoidea virens]
MSPVTDHIHSAPIHLTGSLSTRGNSIWRKTLESRASCQITDTNTITNTITITITIAIAITIAITIAVAVAIMGRQPLVIKWVLDTRPLWPAAKATRDLGTEAARAFALLTAEERASILKYHFVKDAKLALGSALLKRLAISSHCSVPWSSAQFVRDARTKPVFLLPDKSEPLVFNVSHQAGLVVLFAVHRPPPQLSVGVDVVCPSERRDRDHALVGQDGWTRFVEMHESVLAPGEAARLRALLPLARDDADDVGDVDGRLAYFYALWCLREGYVKMTGEALLAEWLGDLEMRNFRPPGGGGQLEVWFRGERVEGLDVRLEWFLGDYMICTVVRGVGDDAEALGVRQQGWELLDVDAVVDAAERAAASA